MPHCVVSIWRIVTCLRIHDDLGLPTRPETLHGLLILRIKPESEMVELGFSPSPLVAQPSNN